MPSLITAASNATAVVTLGDNDALSFVVTHAPVVQANVLQIDPTFGTAYDRHEFQVDVMVARRFDTHVGTQRFIQVHQKDSVAIRSFQPLLRPEVQPCRDRGETAGEQERTGAVLTLFVVAILVTLSTAFAITMVNESKGFPRRQEQQAGLPDRLFRH